ncbi:MAG: hypothetical protein HY521_05340 [Proteobacteria bacterium]|nr:hypothetical protein [Pseudomonadota bacterium]
MKALSAEQVEDLLAGRGLSLALAAELNRYPGPTHVLDLAEALGLSEAQAGEMRALKARMQGEARALGRAIVEKEATLDRLFAGGAAEDGALGTLVFAIARLEGELRHTHLRYHLLARALLSPEQVAEYVRLRGYAGAPAGGDSSHRHGTMGAHN